ncbi:MAG: protein kinase family protein [Candidatus Zixiibacteriota bacterium]
MSKDIIPFIRKKDYKFIRNIGQGATGKTVLLKDEIIDEYFVCKKYAPSNNQNKERFFTNFVREVKLLNKLSHKNIVRIYNNYLYPNSWTGYILMEYIDGVNIQQYLINNAYQIDDIFIQTIGGFKHLKDNGILHRDIRPNNILVSNEGTVKIIDFGFGKNIEMEQDFDKSVSLNWLYSPPIEFKHRIYDFKTEVYFVGKLFESLLNSETSDNFSFGHTLTKMIEPNPEKRLSSFFAVEREINSKEYNEFDFSDIEKGYYQEFADQLLGVIKYIGDETKYITNIEIIIKSLEEIYNNSILENYIQNSYKVVGCFIDGYCELQNKYKIKTSIFKNFIDVLRSKSREVNIVILNNLWQRFDTVIRTIDPSDLPF